MSFTSADLFLALDELETAGILEWRLDTHGGRLGLATHTLREPSAAELLTLSPVAAVVWEKLSGVHEDLVNREKAERN